jgi:hypothetical protein
MPANPSYSINTIRATRRAAEMAIRTRPYQWGWAATA